MFLLSGWFLMLPLLISSLDLPSTSSWRKPGITASREERINRTAAAIDMFIKSDTFFNSPPPQPLPNKSWPYGELLAEIADFDILTNQTRYKEVVQKYYLPALQDLVPLQSRYGYAAARAYLAYKDDAFLTVAERYWASARALTLSDEEVAVGKSSAKTNITIPKDCTSSGTTLAGGTFHDALDDNDGVITAASTGDYMALTLSLAMSTPNQTYTDLAKEMSNFLLSVMYKGSGVVSDDVIIQQTGACIVQENRFDKPYNTGAVIQGLSMLASVTEDSDSGVMSDLRDITLVAITNASWYTDDGILDLSDRTNEYSQRLLRSYFDLTVGNDTPTDLKTYLQQYIAVQRYSTTPAEIHRGTVHCQPFNHNYGNAPPRGIPHREDSRMYSINYDYEQRGRIVNFRTSYWVPQSPKPHE
ncbi:hypothetical protein V5O48_004004 [Marasmius crinis-equi]|uniref:Uncharacterized protein n=1 Tax=Marasmius crinis-equi TaxID=585013 RepID=A0ABR3FR78_9AGAR